MSNSSEIVPPAGIVLSATALSAAELVLHPVALLVSLFNLTLLASTALLHPNLKSILCAQSVSIALAEIGRMVYVAEKFTGGNMFPSSSNPVMTLCMLAITFRGMVAHWLMAERAMATWLFREYAKFRGQFGCLAIGIMSFVTVWFTMSQDGNYWSFNASTIAEDSAMICIGIAEILSLALLHVYNMRKYTHEMTLSLNERFQLSENVRTTRQLGPAFVLHLANMLLASATSFLVYFDVISPKQSFAISLSFALTQVLSSIMDAFIELTVITHHPVIRRKAWDWIWNCGRCKRGNRVGDVSSTQQQQQLELKDLNGKPLIVNPKQESHFRMMNEWWK